MKTVSPPEGRDLTGSPHSEVCSAVGGSAPIVHAVIVHHHGAGLLIQAVDSLLASDGVRLEVVVVANACDEPIPEELRAHPAVHWVESGAALGFSEANNRGVRWACESLGTASWYYFVNNDTISTRAALRQMLETARSEPGCGIVGPRLMIAGAETYLNSLGLRVTTVGEAWDEGIGQHLEEYGPLASCREVLAVTGSALLVRADVFKALREWTELYEYYYEDIDLCLKARGEGFGVLNVASAVVYHMISATSDSLSDFKRYHSWRNRFLLMTSHWPTGLLLRTAPRVLATEVAVFARRLWIGETGDARLQLRSWLGALRLLPKTIRRRRPGRATKWTELLSPPGSVPEIHLPQPAPPGTPTQGHVRV